MLDRPHFADWEEPKRTNHQIFGPCQAHSSTDIISKDKMFTCLTCSGHFVLPGRLYVQHTVNKTAKHANIFYCVCKAAK